MQMQNGPYRNIAPSYTVEINLNLAESDPQTVDGAVRDIQTQLLSIPCIAKHPNWMTIKLIKTAYHVPYIGPVYF